MPDALSAAARLDRLPIGAFHRRTAALLAYVFFFELGDLNSFAYAAPALRQQWHLSIATIATHGTSPTKSGTTRARFSAYRSGGTVERAQSSSSTRGAVSRSSRATISSSRP